VVTRLLNELESLPHVYLGDGQIPPSELGEAVRAFSNRSEYSWPGPFHERFDAANRIAGPAPTRLFVHHSLAERIFTIAREDPTQFSRDRLPLAQLQAVLQNDRACSNPPKVSDNFRVTIRRHLQLYGVAAPGISLPDLADWIYELPARCPGVRLQYDVYHQVRRNLGDGFDSSDFGDLAHVRCLPYVDLATLDRRMATYVNQ